MHGNNGLKHLIFWKEGVAYKRAYLTLISLCINHSYSLIFIEY
jgi:hypothetical protein